MVAGKYRVDMVDKVREAVAFEDAQVQQSIVQSGVRGDFDYPSIQADVAHYGQDNPAPYRFPIKLESGSGPQKGHGCYYPGYYESSRAKPSFHFGMRFYLFSDQGIYPYPAPE